MSKVIYIRSTMTYLSTAIGEDQVTFLDDCYRHGVNTLRWPVIHYDGDKVNLPKYHPHKLLGWWNPYGLCGAPGYPDVPQVDLTQKDEESWALYRRLFIAMRDRDITPWIVFRDQCSESEDTAWRYFKPFYGCLQMWPYWQTIQANGKNYYTNQGKLDAAIAGGGMGPGLDSFHLILYQWFYDLAKEVGIPIIYGEPMNEMGWRVGPNDHFTLKDMERWFKKQCDLIRQVGYTKVIGSCRPDMSNQTIAAWVDIVDMHCISKKEDVNAGSIPANKQLWDTDGALSKNNEGPGASVYGMKDVGVNQITALGQDAVRQQIAGLDWLSQAQIASREAVGWYLPNVDMNIEEAMSRSLEWTPPMVTKEICKVSCLLANDTCPDTEEKEFIEWEAPTEVCTTPHYTTLPVCNSSHLLPNENCTQMMETFVVGTEPKVVCTACKPCSYFLRHLNIIDWLRCVIFGKH